MTNRMRMGIVLLVLTLGLAGCGRSDSWPTPSAPSPVQQPATNQLVVFKDPLTGLSTSDVRDAQDHIVQFTMAAELIWTADGSHLPGHYVDGPGHRVQGNFAAEAPCQCWLVVRFGTSGGERRAYLTGDYIHFNPGTVVALAITANALVVTPTEIFPPGRSTLSGVITEATETGLAPVENAGVYRLNEEESGWDAATTDGNGFYEIHGLSDGGTVTGVSREGYQKVEQAVSIHGDTRFDVQLVRQ